MHAPRRIPLVLIAALLAFAGLGLRTGAAAWHHHDRTSCTHGHDHGPAHTHGPGHTHDHSHDQAPPTEPGPAPDDCSVCVALAVHLSTADPLPPLPDLPALRPGPALGGPRPAHALALPALRARPPPAAAAL